MIEETATVRWHDGYAGLLWWFAPAYVVISLKKRSRQL
jgi:hypothetical protein